MAGSPERPARSAIPLTGILCAAAGAVDVIAYLRLGNVFVGNMTGNTVLFAASILMRNWKEAGLRIGVVIAFMAGILLAHTALHKWMSRRQRRTRLLALAIEFVLLCALACVSHPDELRVLLLVFLALGLGVQNDAFHSIDGINVNTSFITGDLENLGSALASSETPGERKQARQRVAVFFTTWMAYAIGALVGAAGALHFAEKALFFPAALVIMAAVLVLRSSST